MCRQEVKVRFGAKCMSPEVRRLERYRARQNWRTAASLVVSATHDQRFHRRFAGLRLPTASLPFRQADERSAVIETERLDPFPVGLTEHDEVADPDSISSNGRWRPDADD